MPNNYHKATSFFLLSMIMSINRFDFVRDGATRLPPGFRFQPTDEELVFEYLKCKLFSCPLPASIIPEINVCNFDPWDLPGDIEQERYFFSSKYWNGKRSSRTSGCGYWKATGSDKQIGSARRNHMAIGMKKTLVFYKGKPRNGSRTDWVMHEYHLVQAPNNSIQYHCVSQMDSWVVCRIFSKKRSTKNDSHIIKSDCHYVTTKLASLIPSSSSSSSSSSCSDITEVSSSGSDHEKQSH